MRMPTLDLFQKRRKRSLSLISPEKCLNIEVLNKQNTTCIKNINNIVIQSNTLLC